MPYIYLAASYDELQAINRLVNDLEKRRKPVILFRDEVLLTAEFERVKASACRDILVFGLHYDDYIRYHLTGANSLAIRVIDLIESFRSSLVLSEMEEYLYQCAVRLRMLLGELVLFYEKLGNRVVG